MLKCVSEMGGGGGLGDGASRKKIGSGGKNG